MDKGVDFSHWQRRADWLALKEVDGINFGYFKMSEGDYFYDQHFDYYAEGASRESVEWAPYHFFRRNISALAQFNTIQNAIIPCPGISLPDGRCIKLIQDVEKHPADPLVLSAAQKSQLRLSLEELVQLSQANLLTSPEDVIGIYTGFYYWRDNVGAVAWARNCALILASYRSTPPPVTLIPAPWTDWDICQHSQSGRLFGIDGAVDLDWRR